MAITKSPSFHDNWSWRLEQRDDVRVSKIGINRFGSHTYNVIMPKKGGLGFNIVVQTRPYIKLLKKKFQKYYRALKEVAVDKSMLKCFQAVYANGTREKKFNI